MEMELQILSKEQLCPEIKTLPDEKLRQFSETCISKSSVNSTDSLEWLSWCKNRKNVKERDD